MDNRIASRKTGAKLISLLLVLVMLFGMVPASLADEVKDTVHVIVENTTYAGASWTGTLLDTNVEIDESSTMMSCIEAAVKSAGKTLTITNSGTYISEIAGISQKDNGDDSGWMGTLNDWFTASSFDTYTTKAGTLDTGDEIRVMYTSEGLGADIGGDYNGTDKTLKAIAFSTGTLDKTFASDTHEYTLYVPKDTTSVTVTPTASNKNFQVKTYVSDTEYKRSAAVPISVGTVITVKCGDPTWSANAKDNTGAAQTYTFTVAEEVAHTPIEVSVSVSNAGTFAKDKNGADAVNMKVALDTKETYTVGDIIIAAHEQYSANGTADFASKEVVDTTFGNYTQITKMWGVETTNCGYYINGTAASGFTAAVKTGDKVELFIYANTEAYATFDKSTVETDDATAFDLTLTYCTGYDSETFAPIMGACADATITVDGVATETKTDENGKATITISTAGTHIISATKMKTVDDKEVTAITAPLCTATVTATAIASGTSGNTTWKLRTDGTLEFSAVEGTDGKMADASRWSAPSYNKYSSQIMTAVLKEGVTYLGGYAFTGCTLSSLSLPQSLTSISKNSLLNATITGVTVAEGGTYSASGNFLLKNNGEEIAMVIDETKLTGVVSIPEGVTTVGNGIFNSSEITGLVIPNSVTSIAQYAISNCSKLESVTVPCDLTNTYAFSNCTALKTVTIAEGVTTIADYSFNGCTALTTVSLPKSLTTMTGKAWNNCAAISAINVTDGGSFSMKDGMLLKNNTEIVLALKGALSGELTIPEGVTALGAGAFDGCKGITSVKFPSTIKTIGDDAFWGCTGLTSVTIPEGVTTLGAEAFASCSKLETVNLPSTLETMSNYAFSNCKALTSLVCPENLTSIGQNAFYNCTALKSISLPDKLTTLGTSAFGGCSALESITVPCDIPDSAFWGCTALKTVTVKEGAKSVGNQAFSGCTALQSVSLPSSITTLGANVFASCNALTSVTIAEGGTLRCSDGMICSSTQVLMVLPYTSGDITIPSGITEISASAFSGNTKITSVGIPDSVATIGGNTFYNCTALTSVKLPAGLTTISSSMFQSCTALKSVNIPSTVTRIEDMAFYGCTSLSMSTAELIPSGLQYLGGGAFSDCKNITGALTLPASIVTYGSTAFMNCTGITSVTFEDSANPDTVNYGRNLFYNCSGIKSIRLPENIKSMNGMLYGCSGLKELTLPAGITSVSARNELNNPSKTLRYLEIKGATTVNSIASVGSNLEQLVLPATLTTYNDTASYCHPTIICYRGTEEQWNQITFNKNTLANFEKYGTIIIYEYDETASAGDPIVITEQPESATYEQGTRPAPLSIEIEEVEGATYIYTWYRNGETFGSDKTCAISTATDGSFEFYCVIKCIKDNKISEVRSDVVTITVTAAETSFAGSGTADDPYQLSTSEDLDRLSVYVEGGESYEGKYFAMQNDITLPTNWVPIGCTKDGTRDIKSGTNMNAFSGTFDGKGHTLTVPADEKPLFAYVKGATIKHLKIYGTQINGFGLINNMEGVGLSGTAVVVDDVTLLSGTQTLKSGILGAEITTNGFAGCSAGYVSTIKNCTIEKGVIIGYDGEQSMIGSIAGRMQGTITNCVSYATVKGKNYVGGINGTRDNAMGTCTVSNCTFGGTVIATGKNAGGITGGGYGNSTAPNGAKVSINGCTVSGSVSGDTNVGGILGGDMYVAQGWSNVAGTFKDNVFTGTVSGNTNVGAIIGFYDSINRVDGISGNAYSATCGADKPVGAVYVVDTNYENPTAYGDTLYINTETSTDSCPAVTGCGWKTGYNRTDDPLGKDIANLFEVLSADGDVNMDGKIDVDDVTLAYNYYLAKTTLKAAQISVADVDKNGIVDLDDILLLHDYVLGKVDSLTPAA